MAEDDHLGSILEKLQNSPLREHATEIGLLCIFWSRLELETVMFLDALMQPVDNHVAIITITNMGFREKLNAILALGFHKKPHDDWFSELKKTINDIDNNLRPRRNRFVHDHWLQAGGDIIKFTMTTAVYKEQARTLALKLYEVQTPSPGNILSLTIMVLGVSGTLQALRAQLPASRDKSSQPDPQPDPGSG